MYSLCQYIILCAYHCSLRTYKALVRPYLIDGNQTLFTCLRQKMAFLSTLSYTEPGLPRFGWNPEMTVLSIDGFALPLNKFKDSIESSLLDMKQMMDKLFLKCPWQDILDYIDSRTDPTDPNNWFLDRPQQSDQNTSIFNFHENGLDIYKDRLLGHLADNPVFFTTVNGVLVPQRSMTV